MAAMKKHRKAEIEKRVKELMELGYSEVSKRLDHLEMLEKKKDYIKRIVRLEFPGEVDRI
jgi:hypothetical protein